MTTTVSLTIPKGREGCIKWLQDAATADEVANLLETAEAIFSSACNVHAGVSTVRSHAVEIERVRAEQQHEMQRALDELRPMVEMQCRTDAEQQMNDLRMRHASEVRMLSTNVESMRTDVERLQAELSCRADKARQERDDAVDRVSSELEGMLTEANETIERYKGKEAMILAEARKEHDEQLSMQERNHARQVEGLQTLLRDVQVQSESTASLMMDKLRLQHDSQVASLLASHQQQLDHMRADVARRDNDVRDLQEGTFGKVESLVGSLCGNSAKKGELGEDFVKWVHDRMELGVLTRTGKLQCPGHADFLWEHTPPDCVKIRGMVENKYGEHANSKRDLSKFREDVREAAKTQRINAAMYISLVDRLAGKPKLSIELFHGIPTMWVARDANDDLSGATLVEMAFSVFSHVWPLLCVRDQQSVESTMQHVCNFLKGQIGEHEKLDASIRVFEKMADSVRREVMQLRRTRDALVTNVYTFQARHLPQMDIDERVDLEPVDPMDTELGKRIVNAIKGYLASMPSKKCRYPKNLGELASHLSTEEMAGISHHQGMFELAVRKVKASTSAEAIRKREKRKQDDL